MEGGFNAVGIWWPFMLAYQEADNRALLSRHGALCHRLMQHWQQTRGYRPARADSDRIRVGIVSSYIHDHAVWHALIKGWLRHLDRSQFELKVFHVGSVRDAETRIARDSADEFVEGAGNLQNWAETIVAQRPEVLIYPDIGMDTLTIKLASLRLAPVQMTSWGHPETSGLPTMDYYLSAADFESGDSDAYYTEKLLRLPHLGCSYQRLAVEHAAIDLARLGLAGDHPLLLSPGSPYKYGPQFDWIYPAIVRGIGPCKLVFFTYFIREMSEIFQQRLRRAFARADSDYDAHVAFIPWLPRPAFYGLLRRADVYLDTLGFSGFNTAMQAIECGLPIVTREGHFLRGRFASGILRRMGLGELVVQTENDYVALAVRIARDTAFRHGVRHRIEQSRHTVFDDQEPIRGLEKAITEIARP
jgi:predicted O-linked N-acetylglucosamine transferase (SPINDLY family)